MLQEINHPALTSWIQWQRGTICAHPQCHSTCGEICRSRWSDQDHPTQGAGQHSAPLEIEPRAECGNSINQLIIPLPAPPMHSLVSELGFFAFLQSSWRWDVEHGVLLLLMVLKKNISSAGWHVLIICEGKMSARFGVRKAFSSRSD